MNTRIYGWRKQEYDPRDRMFAARASIIGILPPSVDLRSNCPEVYNQGRIGSCTANAIGAALQFCQIKEGLKSFTPSRLFIYWNERNIEGSVDRDAGAVIRNGLKVVSSIGACNESRWSYDDTPADPSTGLWAKDAKPRAKPNCFAFRYAKEADALEYLAVIQQLDQMRGCLAAGFPFIFGFQVFPAFEGQTVARTGVADLPGDGEKAIGGHAVLAVGYDDATQRFLVRNSWGSRWGQGGYFTIPYAYLTDPHLASDFWTIRKV